MIFEFTLWLLLSNGLLKAETRQYPTYEKCNAVREKEANVLTTTSGTGRVVTSCMRIK